MEQRTGCGSALTHGGVLPDTLCGYASARKNEISGTANGPKNRGRSVLPGGGIRRRRASIDGSAKQAGAARQLAKRSHTMLWTVRIGMVPAAANRIKRGIAGVERNRPSLNWTAVFDSSWRVKDPSAARVLGVVDRAIVQRCHRVYVGRD